MSDPIDQLIEDHFEAQAELLPDGALDTIKQGQGVKIVTIPGASQLEITETVQLITAVVALITAVIPLLPKKKTSKDEIRGMILKKYPVIVSNMEEDELEAFIGDIMKK